MNAEKIRPAAGGSGTFRAVYEDETLRQLVTELREMVDRIEARRDLGAAAVARAFVRDLLGDVRRAAEAVPAPAPEVTTRDAVLEVVRGKRKGARWTTGEIATKALSEHGIPRHRVRAQLGRLVTDGILGSEPDPDSGGSVYWLL